MSTGQRLARYLLRRGERKSERDARFSAFRSAWGGIPDPRNTQSARMVGAAPPGTGYAYASTDDLVQRALARLDTDRQGDQPEKKTD